MASIMMPSSSLIPLSSSEESCRPYSCLVLVRALLTLPSGDPGWPNLLESTKESMRALGCWVLELDELVLRRVAKSPKESSLHGQFDPNYSLWQKIQFNYIHIHSNHIQTASNISKLHRNYIQWTQLHTTYIQTTYKLHST